MLGQSGHPLPGTMSGKWGKFKGMWLVSYEEWGEEMGREGEDGQGRGWDG